MMNRLTSLLILTILSLLSFKCKSKSNTPSQPNIMFILMDDVGWNDVSFMGSQIPTPNIDALYSESVFFTKHYIHLMCSPSRSQIITGRYSMYQGFGKMMPWDYTELGGIPVGQPTVANWLKSLGNYATYAVGKWHMGYAYQGLLPGSRGFDHFFGFYQGAIHYENLKYIDIKFGDSNHFDFWQDGRENHIMEKADPKTMNSMRLYKQKIIDNIYDENRNDDTPFYMYLALQTIHGPLNEIHEKEDECMDVLGEDTTMSRLKYCENMLLTDDIIGDIVTALHDANIYDNTLIIFTSDNGADVSNSGCNYPLRGTKGTLFDGNIKTLAFIAGGLIPIEQRGTKRDVLFSSLDWTPTLLHYARALHNIKKVDYTWDGVDQHDLIMKGVGVNDEYVKRDHIVFNIGLRNLDSASIVFTKNNHLYKYIAQDGNIDQWTYKREDGWCVPEQNGDWNMILDDDISLAQHVNDKYLFDLTYDISERTNLLQLSDQDEDNTEIVNFAKEILTSYTHHSLFSEHLKFLWNRLDAGDPKLFGEGSFVAPFLTEHEYFRHLAKGFSRIEEKFEQAAIEAEEQEIEFNEVMPYGKKLKALYFHKWTPPVYAIKKPLNTWYIYTIIGIVIVALIVIVIISIARWRHLRSFYKDGYEPIANPARNNMDKNALKHDEVQELLNKNSNSTSNSNSDSESDNNTELIDNNSNDRAEYTHVDSNSKNVNVKTPLISVQN
eukprot:497154_1